MRGTVPQQQSMVVLLSPEGLVPENHPIRPIKALVDEALRKMSPTFDAMYAEVGRPSIPPERLVKGMLLMAFFSVRSERLLCEQIRYNMLFRWFLDMDMTETPFDHSVFSKNRDRLLEYDVARKLFEQVVAEARTRHLLSSDHFTVDGTLIEAWASVKSFRPKDDDKGDGNGFGDFKGTTRTNDTHESKTDPDSKLYRKGHGRESKLSYMTHLQMENRNGLVVDIESTQANGTAERDAAVTMLARERAARGDQAEPRRVTVGADKAYDTAGFVANCRDLRVTPHVAQNVYGNRRSAIDGRVTRHAGYAMSMRARMLVEKVFGWMKTTGGFRRTRFRGLPRTSFAAELVATAFNVVRIIRLSAPVPV